MIELLVLGGLVLVGLAIAAVASVVFLLLKLVFWVVFLPFRLLFRLLMIPIWIMVGLLGAGAAALALPVVFIALAGVALVGLVAAALAVLLPATPFILLGLLIWAIFKPRPVTA
jgi:hypothetical protein